MPAGVRGLIVFGGTFDPPHRAHAALPDLVRRRAAPGSFLLYVPAARSPHKPGAPGAPDADRLEMLRLTIAGLRDAAIWTDEIDRGGPSYMIDTLLRLRGVVPRETRPRLLIGSDQAAAFHAWRSPREILSLAPALVMPRPPLTTREQLDAELERAAFWSREERGVWRAAFVDCPIDGVTATRVRELLGRVPRDEGALKELLAPGVLGYIRGRGLYRPAE